MVSSTSDLVGSSTQSSRRSTVNGRITRPYSDCLYTPRSRSATDQMNPAWFLIAAPLIPPLPRSPRPHGRPIEGRPGGVARPSGRTPLALKVRSQHAEATHPPPPVTFGVDGANAPQRGRRVSLRQLRRSTIMAMPWPQPTQNRLEADGVVAVLKAVEQGVHERPENEEANSRLNRKWPGNRIGYGRKIGYRAPAENGLFIITGSLRSTQASQLPSTGRVMPLDMFPLTVAEKTQSAAASLFDRIASGDLGSAAPGLDANDYMDMALASGYPRAMTMPSKALRASARRARVDQTLNVDSLLGRQDRAKLLEFARVYASHTVSRRRGRPRRRPRLGRSAVDAVAVAGPPTGAENPAVSSGARRSWPCLGRRPRTSTRGRSSCPRPRAR